MNNLTEAIDKFVELANQRSAEYWQKGGYTHSPAPTRSVVLGPQWCKVYVVEHQHDGFSQKTYIFAFIALKDFENKTLGVVRQGDIFKPASYEAPAKTARGNIFENMDCVGPTCIAYLR